MKSLISVTPREYKRDFNEVMEMCTDLCMTNNQEIIITFAKAVEIAAKKLIKMMQP